MQNVKNTSTYVHDGGKLRQEWLASVRNLHQHENTTVYQPPHTTVAPYDGVGAMKFTVAVVLVYGVAVIGVFVMGYFGRRRKGENEEMDRQANVFLKSFDHVRTQLQKEKQVGSVTNVLRRISTYEVDVRHVPVKEDSGLSRLGKDMFPYMALPMLVSHVTSDSGIESEGVVPSPSGEEKFPDRGETGQYDILPHKLEIVEETADEDLDDNVFMTEEERLKYGVDFYVDMRESDI